MPELPEVKTIVDKLKIFLIGEKIKKLKILKVASFLNPLKVNLEGSEIKNLDHKGKLIILTLSNNYFLVIHLKMTGQLILQQNEMRISGGHPSIDWVGLLPNNHTRIVIDFEAGEKLFFNDMRMFGYFKIVNASQLQIILNSYGPNGNSEDFNLVYFKKNFNLKSRINIKQLLLKQEFVAGIGNIYASEILFASEIYPLKLVRDLSDWEIERIINNSRLILNLAIEKGGTTFDGRYLNALGQKGGFQDYLKVYQKDNCQCSKCLQKIVKIKINGRSTFFCPHCQSLS